MFLFQTKHSWLRNAVRISAVIFTGETLEAKSLFSYSSVGGLSLVVRKSYWKPNALEEESKQMVCWGCFVTAKA